MKQKSRILIGLTYYYPNLSGLTLYAKILAENLTNNYQVSIITSRFDKKLRSEEANGVKIIRVNGFHLGKGVIMPGYFWKSLLAVKNSEIVNIHLPCVESFWLAIWSKIFNKKLIITYHCYFESDNKILEKIVNIIHDFILRLADKIIVNSLDYIEGNQLLINSRNKIKEIYPPILIKRPNKEELDEVNKKFYGLGNKKIIGFLGRISQEKSVETLIKTIPCLQKKIKNFAIVLAGSQDVAGEEKYKEKINKLINKYKKYIYCIGPIKNPTAFFQKCDCLVLPSTGKMESFGMVQAEAMRCGLKSICADLPGIRVPIIVGEQGKLFKPNNSNDLCKKIIEILNEKEKFKLSEEAEVKFDYRNTIKEYIKILSKL